MKSTIYGTKGQYYLPLSSRLMRIVLNGIGKPHQKSYLSSMKRINENISKFMPPACLYREDISAIADALVQENGKLIIKTEKYEYDSIDELLSNQEDSLKGLSINRETPYISINFNRSNDGILNQIQEILELNKKRTHLILKRFINGSGWLGTIAAGIFIAQGYWDKVFLCILLPLIDMAYIFVKKDSIINRDSRTQTKSFWQRNFDQIVVVIIGAVVGTVLTIIVTALLRSNK